MEKVLTVSSLLLMMVASTPLLHGDAALEDSNRVRRQAQEYNQDIQQQREVRAEFGTQNLENQRLDLESDESNQLEVTPPQPLWDNGSGY